MITNLTFTCLPVGFAGESLRIAAVADPELIAEAHEDVVDLSQTAIGRWPEVVAGFGFKLHFAKADQGLQVHMLALPGGPEEGKTLWRDLLGANFHACRLGSDRERRLTTSSIAALGASSLTYDAGAVRKDVEDLFRSFEFTPQSGEPHPLFAGSSAVQAGEPEPVDERQPTAASVLAGFTRLVGGVPQLRADAAAFLFATAPSRVLSGPIFDVRPFWNRKESEIQALSVSPKPPASFHEVIGHLGCYPAIMRRVGLILEFEVPLSGLSPTADRIWIEAGAPVGQKIQVAPAPHTAVVIDRPRRRFFTPSRPESPELAQGMLPLENGEHYNLMQTDLDSAALALEAYVKQLHDLLQSESAPPLPPSLHTSGLWVANKGRKQKTIQDQGAHASLTKRVAVQELLYAEDVVAGYRVDVWQKSSGKWRSLLARRVRCGGIDFAPDEGWAGDSFTVQGKEAFVHESLFLWGGWSLAAPRPGKVLGKDGRLHAAAADETLRGIRIKALELPTLRFGDEYRVRAHGADLAGGNMATAQSGPLEDDNVHTAPASNKSLVYRRLEPVPSPILLPREDLADYPGEGVDIIVYRDTDRNRKPERHVAPPRASITLAEAHGMFDRQSRPDPNLYEDRAARCK